MSPPITETSQRNDLGVTSSRPPTKTPTHTLVRVRNNQRRHRERRREYIAILEKRLAETQDLLMQAEAKINDLNRELSGWKSANSETEERFNDLTSTVDDTARVLGLPPVLMHSTELEQQYRSEGDDFLEISSLHRPPGCVSELEPSGSILSTSASNTADLANLLVMPTERLTTSSLTLNPEHLLDPVSSTRSFPCCGTDEKRLAVAFASLAAADDFGTSLVLSADYPTYSSNLESTTLCSQAYIMITQQNFRGLNAHAIRNWLYPGFRRAKTQDEGCRVDNRLLFEVLDFINST